jgi:pimeloyl-ACP methyl ester carboxylesterase
MAGNRSVLNDPAEALGGRSCWTDVDGPVHYLDFGGPARGPVIVGVHGLGGSAVNWSAIAPLLTGQYRFVAPDLAGFGLTRPGRRDTTVSGNQALLHRFIESVPVTARQPVILMGNSMGGMISLLEASSSPARVAALVLVDSALPFVPARPDPVVAATFVLNGLPGVGVLVRGLRRDTPAEVQVARLLALCCADPGRVPARTVGQHVEMERRRQEIPGRSQALITAMRSVVRLAGHRRGSTYRAILDAVGCPVLLLQGDRDRLVPVAVARAAARAHPSWALEVLPGIGHVPQLEAPEETARLITGWLGGDGRTGRSGAGRSGAGRAGADAQARPLRAVFRTTGQKVSRALGRSPQPGQD